jgi:hypothetical protein
MQVSNFVVEALNNVIDCDLPEDGYSEAVNAQVCLMAGLESEDVYSYDMDRMVH